MPALHCASTKRGVETMNMGAPMTGNRRRSRKRSGIGIYFLKTSETRIPKDCLALWRTRADSCTAIGIKLKHIVLAFTVLAALASPLAALADQPPLIDRNLFYGEVAISGAQISPDGRLISFLKPYKGTRNIWVKGADEPFSAARPVSAEATRPIRSYFWSHDSKYILYSQDSGGDENFNIYAIDPRGAADTKTGVPPTRALTNLKGVRTQIYAVPRAKPDILYIGLNDRDAHWHDLYELHLSSGEKTLLRKNTENIAGWDFDHDGVLRLAERTNSAGDTEILRVDADGFKKIYTCTVLENCDVYGFDATNEQV